MKSHVGVEKNDQACVVYLNGLDKYVSVKMGLMVGKLLFDNKSYALNFVYTAKAHDPLKIVVMSWKTVLCVSVERYSYICAVFRLTGWIDQWLRLLTPVRTT